MTRTFKDINHKKKKKKRTLSGENANSSLSIVSDVQTCCSSSDIGCLCLFPEQHQWHTNSLRSAASISQQNGAGRNSLSSGTGADALPSFLALQHHRVPKMLPTSHKKKSRKVDISEGGRERTMHELVKMLHNSESQRCITETISRSHQNPFPRVPFAWCSYFNKVDKDIVCCGFCSAPFVTTDKEPWCQPGECWNKIKKGQSRGPLLFKFFFFFYHSVFLFSKKKSFS